MARLPIAQRRKRIVDAAITVALREGIEGLTTRQVAAEAGVVVSVLHYCFGTRDELLRAVVTRVVDETSRSMAPAFEGDPDLRACLSRAIEAYCSAVEANPESHLLLYEMTTQSVRNPQLADLGAWQYDSYHRATESFFEQLAEVARVTWSLPVSSLARLMVAQNEGVTLAWLVDRDGTRARTTYAAFTDLLAGLAIPASPGAHADSGVSPSDPSRRPRGGPTSLTRESE